MRKIYTLEIPIYSHPVARLNAYNKLDNINIIMYGGFPNSPLNGGRFNYALDGLFLWDRLFFELNTRQLVRITKRFYDTVTAANKSGIPFLVAFTNMFISPEELSEENLAPVKWLAEAADKYGVKNGVILNNQLLEAHLRAAYKGRLAYVSSCTKYVSPQKILSPAETLAMYKADVGRYDYVVVTPQDSRRENLLKDLTRENADKVVAISNSYCSNRCNAYHHYKYTSEENKRSLLTCHNVKRIGRGVAFILPRLTTCSAVWQIFYRVDVRKISLMQLEAGVVNFKLGRGLGTELLNQLVRVIQDFDKKG